jgi:hypothetical protein
MAYNRTTWQDSPSTSTPITAAALNNIELGIVAAGTGAGAVYTTEAARDAAITSPTEGMRVYLTAPTVPAATGAITAVPTGIQTIYNGTSWVCITPVGASSQTSGTSTATAAGTTTLTGDAVAISVTLTTGTTALVSVSGGASTNSATRGVIAYALSGATTQSASLISTGAEFATVTSDSITGTRSFIATGMTAGTNTFTLNYWSTAAATLTWTNRNITVQGIA